MTKAPAPSAQNWALRFWSTAPAQGCRPQPTCSVHYPDIGVMPQPDRQACSRYDLLGQGIARRCLPVVRLKDEVGAFGVRVDLLASQQPDDRDSHTARDAPAPGSGGPTAGRHG